MNKKLIAVAVAAGLMPGVALADATVYGHGQVEVASWGGDDSGGVSVEDNARGRIGVMGEQDLGGGLKGLFLAEYKTDFADGDSSGSISLTKREMMVGLAGGFGQIELGRLKQAYKYIAGVKYDPFVATVLEARSNGAMSGQVGAGNSHGHNGFISDSIGYDGKFGIVHIRATYDLDDGGGDGVGTDPNGANAWTLGVEIGEKNWGVALATTSDDAAAAAEYSASKLAGHFSFADAHTIRAQYETVDQANNSNDAEYLYLDYEFKFGKNSIHASWGEFDEDNGSANDEEFLRLAYMYKFSKQVRVWAGYRETDRDGSTDDVDVVSLGLRVDI